MAQPRLWLLAGPNGAGKTTYARQFYAELIEEQRFLNADDIAQAASPDNAAQAAIVAARSVLRRRRSLIRQRVSFAIETTLASQTLLRFAAEAKEAGFALSLIFLFISHPEICIQRVAQRVATGGHHIASDVVRRRYDLGLRLLPRFVALADTVDIRSVDEEPVPILEKTRRGMRIHKRKIWNRIVGMSAKT
jgi:predicted ABC-type ATPase